MITPLEKIRCNHSSISWLQIYTTWSFLDLFQFLIGKSDITNVLSGEISISYPSSCSKVIPCNNSRGYCTHHFLPFVPTIVMINVNVFEMVPNIFRSTCTDWQMSFSARESPGTAMTIQIRWEFCFVITSNLAKRSLQNFVHDTTTMLSWHVQQFVAIEWPVMELQ